LKNILLSDDEFFEYRRDKTTIFSHLGDSFEIPNKCERHKNMTTISIILIRIKVVRRDNQAKFYDLPFMKAFE